ncbi:T9SS type A sorting domain-containing protein, partial [bacterium]|nr:T9SS type A sorting domain-containing protein [bacterium]
YGVSGTPESTLGCQFVNCTLFNNQAVSSTALIDVNAVSSKMVNTLVYSAQHDAFRVLYGGLMTATNCLTNKAITTGTPASSGNVVETVLTNYKFKQAFTKTHTFVDKKSADYAALIAASYLIEDNSSVAVSTKGLENMASFIPTGTANIIPTVDLYNFARPIDASLEYENKYTSYPNPAKDIIYLENKVNTTVDFYNIAGVLVKSAKLTASANSVNIRELPAGSYIVKATVSGQVKTTL